MKEKLKTVNCNGLNSTEMLRWVESILEDKLLYNAVAFENAILILPIGEKKGE